MDVTAASATKTLDTLKSLPTWLLVGLTISLASIWFWPSLFTALPEQLRPIVPAVLLIFVVLTLCNISSMAIVAAREKRRLSIEQDRDRLLKLYRPLEALFLTVHITVCTGTAAPRLRHRIENAWNELSPPGRRFRRLKRGWRALFDKHQSTSAEVEYGADFPLSIIIDLVRKNARYAKPELLDLVRRANRSQCEEPDQVLLTDAEYDLFCHIDAEHRRLSARVT
ncbi:MAG: hypothetical protein EOS72_20625 [Mesorhizobium sp.]|uniref:hypothetical protein n=1 Tax=Mesorhizobium sp. TaxID=1871066 RepID=UPI000FE906E3|nr:hypothetical protein [Mesorhizobium sp.]RWC87653.1 MAG: hypothetical protein EOS72_20625 [Mesorhizobium sp.]